MNVYSIDIRIAATAYIKAGSATVALAKARSLHGDCLNIEDRNQSDVEISGLPYDDPGLPEVSLSPVMTLWEAQGRPGLAADNANRKAEG